MRRKDREVSDIRAITEILALCKTASVAMIEDGTPYVVPLSYGSSIIGNGAAQFIEDPDEKRYALGKMFEHQTEKKVEFTGAQADSVCVFKIVSRDFMGKKKGRVN